MYKVFAFLKRNPNLTHDEYRAGHVGYHCGQSRRLKNIRGYLVNVWDNQPLAEKIGDLAGEIAFNQPDGFLDYWDGFPQVYFDDREAWVNARTVEPNRATADGLVVDPDWSLGDSPHLFMPVPGEPTQFRAHHLHMEEHVVVAVRRPEFRLTKLIQFFQKREGLTDAEFADRLLGEYAPLAGSMPGLWGYVANLRDADPEAAMRGFFAPDSWVFGEEGRALHGRFCSLWRGANELHFDSVEAFAAARRDDRVRDRLLELERELFSSMWHVEVDENLIVIPNRGPAPDFYFR
jgi:hypothetical protein